jgi:LysR family glycine cleavage system transcriptional activator
LRLPPLNALRAFEAAARHQSFVRAAQELHVTQGAVSRHVKLLEEHLDLVLFRRLPQDIELTAQGRALLPELTASFERIAHATRQVTEGDRDLKVASPPTLAERWLVRRLSRFHDLRPGTRVTLGIICGHDEFFRGGFDLGITDFQTDLNRPPGLASVPLRPEAMTPVCAPAALHAPQGGLREPSDLENRVLLHPHADRLDWLRWARMAGLAERVALHGGYVFETLEMAIAAAVGGLGIAIADLHLIREELVSGALVAPFDLVVSEGTGYVLFSEQGRFEEPKIAAFRDWLLAEVASDGFGATSN